MAASLLQLVLEATVATVHVLLVVMDEPDGERFALVRLRNSVSKDYHAVVRCANQLLAVVTHEARDCRALVVALASNPSPHAHRHLRRPLDDAGGDSDELRLQSDALGK